MIQDRFGTALMLVASAWLAMLVMTEPGIYAENNYRMRVGIIAVVVLIAALFPRHLTLSGTVVSFVALGLALNVGFFGLFGMDVQGLVPAALLVIALWLRRHRLDLTDIVLITSVVACGLAILQPNVVLIAVGVVGGVNLLIWAMNAIRSPRASR